MNNKIFWVGILIAIVIAVGGYFFPGGKVVQIVQDVVGAAGTRFPNGLTIGTSGTDNVEVAARTCNLGLGNPSVAMTGTSTRWFTCTGITGVVSGDLVFGTLPGIPHGRTLWSNEFTVGAVQASSTAGAVDVQLFYWGQVATSSFSQATTSFQILFFDTSR